LNVRIDLAAKVFVPHDAVTLNASLLCGSLIAQISHTARARARPNAQAQVTGFQEELAAALASNAALKAQLEAANSKAAAARRESERLRGEAASLR
jgi:hypothetical protein